VSTRDPAMGTSPGEPSEEELRAAYEAELSRVSATDMIAQVTVSLLNLGARRLAPVPPPGAPGGEGASGQPDVSAQGDLEQARDAIDAARALLEILERRIPAELGPLRDALSRLQMAYAREVPPVGASSQPAAQGPGGSPAQEPAQPVQGQRGSEHRGPGPAESSGRLWVPGR
jgi:hypothetical protein